jgi:hypothetical protein
LFVSRRLCCKKVIVLRASARLVNGTGVEEVSNSVIGGHVRVLIMDFNPGVARSATLPGRDA